MGSITEKIRKNKWFLALKRRGGELFDLSDLKIIEPPEGYYMADPFLLDDFVFYELYDYDKGVIAYSVINKDLTLSKPKIVLDMPFHLSFPCLFQDGENVYMTPEQGMSGRLEIYKAMNFPDKWEPICLVDTGSFADPVLYYNGYYYSIYATDSDNRKVIYRSDKINGEWLKIASVEEVHPRSAGQIFKYNGLDIRPVQEIIPQYGRAIHFKDLLKGNIIKSIEPDWLPGLTGTHTFSFNEKFVVIDGKLPL